MLTFVIPVRHHETVRDWAAIHANLAATIRSIAAQSNTAWRAVIVANAGTPLPDAPPAFTIVRVDLPARALPDRRTHPADFYQTVRRDKGARIMAGLTHAQPAGHVMLVDYDDLVSARLAALVAANPASKGWYFEDGYLYSGGAEVYLFDEAFYKFCGTCHIVRADLLDLQRVPEAQRDALVSRWLGSHYFLKDDFDRLGIPLERLPFRGAIYRIGHGDTTSGSPDLAGFVSERATDTAFTAARARNIRPLTPEVAGEFFG
jgi:hypothetical protein